MATIQRFGPCDAEEKYVEIYTDHTAIVHGDGVYKRIAYYNFTILAMYEYSCIIFTANQDIPVKPKIRLKRFCLASRPACYQFTTLQIDFHVIIEYAGNVHYHVNVFGQELRVLDTKRMNVYFNRNEMKPNITIGYNPV